MIRWVIIFLIVSTAAYSQKTRIEGKVVDKETGKAVPFASVGIVGTSLGTSTNLNGEFSLVVDGSVSVRVTCVGYQSVIISSIEQLHLIQLKAVATQLKEVVVFNKPVNANRIVRKAFTSIGDNYDTRGFLQNFFYRQYSKDDSVYERLIEAYVDVWKHNGYRSVRKAAGDREEIRITQLRRSLDLKLLVQGYSPVSLSRILQTDIVAYQSQVKSEHVTFFSDISNLKTDFNNYTFTFDCITTYDDQEVYKINYKHKQDSVLTTSGFRPLVNVVGSLFITTHGYAIVKTEEIKSDGPNSIQSTAYYLTYNDKYYPYHFIREGEHRISENHVYSFHTELISLGIKHGVAAKFTGREPTKEELSAIPYDSAFWANSTMLKTTPVEDKIISDLGGGKSLREQFYLYRQYEANISNGGIQGEEKFNWFKNESKDKRILYIGFWDTSCKNCFTEMEYLKRWQKKYANRVSFILLSLDSDDALWNQLVIKHNLFADGIINYRIGEKSVLAKDFNVKKTPKFILISKDGSLFDSDAKHPSDNLLGNDLEKLVNQQ